MIVSERLCLGHPFLKHHVVRESSGGDRVMWGKVRKPLQSNKLIMISRVPGYGRFEYLVIEYHVNLNMVPLIKAIGF